MRFEALAVEGFRNLATALVEPHPRFNVLAGDNAQGKTNLLEAIYLLGALRSFRANRIEQLLAFGAARALVRARVRTGGLARQLEIELHPGRRTTRLDGKAVRSSADFLGAVKVVLFSSDDLRLPRGGAQARRRFLDRAVFGCVPAYLGELLDYQRVLKSRNALLRQERPRLELLDVYDGQLARLGQALIARRRHHVRALGGELARGFERITTSGLVATAVYQGDPELDALGDAPDAEEAAALLERRLREGRSRDRARGFTGTGPHLDDLELRLGARPARLFASQGQLRALALALKIAEIEIVRSSCGEPPVLLLDDVSSELDARRNAQLFDHLRGIQCQTFITTTHPDHVRLAEDRADFSVVEGLIARS